MGVTATLPELSEWTLSSTGCYDKCFKNEEHSVVRSMGFGRVSSQ